jgi:hypothetical protein
MLKSRNQPTSPGCWNGKPLTYGAPEGVQTYRFLD